MSPMLAHRRRGRRARVHGRRSPSRRAHTALVVDPDHGQRPWQRRHGWNAPVGSGGKASRGSLPGRERPDNARRAGAVGHDASLRVHADVRRPVDRQQLRWRGPSTQAPFAQGSPIRPGAARARDTLRPHLAACPPGAGRRIFVTRAGRASVPSPPIREPAVDGHRLSRVGPGQARGVQRARLRFALAKRPDDLRHAAVSPWLTAGVPATHVAEWVGHSVNVCSGCTRQASSERTMPTASGS